MEASLSMIGPLIIYWNMSVICRLLPPHEIWVLVVVHCSTNSPTATKTAKI